MKFLVLMLLQIMFIQDASSIDLDGIELSQKVVKQHRFLFSIPSWMSYNPDSKITGFRVIASERGKWFIIENNIIGILFFVIRGTTTMSDWHSNIILSKISTSSDRKFKYHTGFYNEALDIIGSKIFRKFNELSRKYKLVYLTGHSRGSGVSAIVCMEYYLKLGKFWTGICGYGHSTPGYATSSEILPEIYLEYNSFGDLVTTAFGSLDHPISFIRKIRNWKHNGSSHRNTTGIWIILNSLLLVLLTSVGFYYKGHLNNFFNWVIFLIIITTIMVIPIIYVIFGHHLISALDNHNMLNMMVNNIVEQHISRPFSKYEKVVLGEMCGHSDLIDCNITSIMNIINIISPPHYDQEFLVESYRAREFFSKVISNMNFSMNTYYEEPMK
jgi:hypothetical protein